VLEFVQVNRRISGKRAQSSGMLFETFIKGMCAIQGISVTQIPSGCKWVSRDKAFPIKSPFDFVLGYEGRSVFLDAKSTIANTFAYSSIDQDQLSNLITASNGGGAGYIIRKPDGVWFVDYKILMMVKPREGVDFSKAIYLGDNLRCDFRRVF
jgi:penicillin-binding protein-related factor A (putative recombinase)